MLRRKLLPLLLLYVTTTAQAQVYKWVDENGQKHFSSQPPVAQTNIEPVKINHGYVGEALPVTEAEPSESTFTASGKDSKNEMCDSAMRWTDADIENLKDIAREQKQSGTLSVADYAEGQKNFEGIKKRITRQNCLTSSGMDQQRYECLSKGLGLMVCSGLAEEAMREGMMRARKP